MCELLWSQGTLCKVVRIFGAIWLWAIFPWWNLFHAISSCYVPSSLTSFRPWASATLRDFTRTTSKIKRPIYHHPEKKHVTQDIDHYKIMRHKNTQWKKQLASFFLTKIVFTITGFGHLKELKKSGYFLV